MVLKEKILKYLIYASGILGAIVFIFSRDLTLYNSILIEKQIPEHFEFTTYGELHNFSRVTDFREEIPMAVEKFRLTERNAPIEDADIITFGDSFFDFSRVKTVPERLMEETGLKVHTIYSFYPLSYFYQTGFVNQDPKIFIFETAEKMIPDRFGPGNKMNTIQTGELSKIEEIDLKLINILNGPTEERYDKVLKHSYLTSWFYRQISTFKFREFGYISGTTPYKYWDEEPWLFYERTLNEESSSFYYQHSQEEIDLYCDNILLLKNRLKEKYNLDFIFMSVPNKYSIYYKYFNPDDTYNNFLPRIYQGLEERGIQFIDLYHPFKNSDHVLYYRSDTHWNEKAVEITVEKILEHFGSNISLNTSVE